MQRGISFYFLALGVLLIRSASAGDLTVPNTFTAGTPAVASEVNANFDAVETEVDDNDARISDLEAGATGADIDLEPGATLINAGDTTVTEVAAVSLTVPGAGYVLVTHSGHVTMFGEPNTIDLGIGDSNTSLDTSVRIGELDAGPNTLRTSRAYSTSILYPVPSAGTYTFYGLAQKNLIFDNAAINVIPQSLTAIHVPNQY